MIDSTLIVDYTEEPEDERSKRDETPSLSFSNTETLSSWMRESHMDADIQCYTKTSVLRRDEYFFRIWYGTEGIYNFYRYCSNHFQGRLQKYE